MHKFKKESIIAPFFYLQHLFLLHISIITLTIINISKVAKNRTIAPVPKNVTSSVKFPINNPATNPIKIAIINITKSMQHFSFLSFLKHMSTCGSIIQKAPQIILGYYIL